MIENVLCRSFNPSVIIPFGIWEKNEAKRIGIDPKISPHCGKPHAGQFLYIHIFVWGCFIIFGMIILSVAWVITITKLF